MHGEREPTIIEGPWEVQVEMRSDERVRHGWITLSDGLDVGTVVRIEGEADAWTIASIGAKRELPLGIGCPRIETQPPSDDGVPETQCFRAF